MRELSYCYSGALCYVTDTELSVDNLVGHGKTLEDAIQDFYIVLQEHEFIENVFNLVEEEEDTNLHYETYNKYYQQTPLIDEFKVLKALHSLRVELLSCARDISTGSFVTTQVGVAP